MLTVLNSVFAGMYPAPESDTPWLPLNCAFRQTLFPPNSLIASLPCPPIGDIITLAVAPVPVTVFDVIKALACVYLEPVAITFTFDILPFVFTSE